MRIRRRAKLTQSEIESLKADLRQRQQLRTVMGENSHDVLSLEFNCNPRTIMRVEKRGPVSSPYTKLDEETMRLLFRRRQVYWQARELHDKHFSRKVILERYNISQETLLRWMHVMQDERRQVDEDFREDRRAA